MSSRSREMGVLAAERAVTEPRRVAGQGTLIHRLLQDSHSCRMQKRC